MKLAIQLQLVHCIAKRAGFQGCPNPLHQANHYGKKLFICWCWWEQNGGKDSSSLHILLFLLIRKVILLLSKVREDTLLVYVRWKESTPLKCTKHFLIDLLNESIMYHQLRTISDVGKWLWMISLVHTSAIVSSYVYILLATISYFLILLYTFRFFLNENLKLPLKNLNI